MALRLRRGTDAERQLITPLEGELIYTTDTKLLYVGDGTTAGGTLVTGAGGGGSVTLDGLTDTDLTGASNNDVLTFNSATNKWEAVAVPGVGILDLDALSDVFMFRDPVPNDALIYDGFSWTPKPFSDFFNEQQNYKINIAGDDSTIIINTDTNDVTGNFFGNLVGNVTGDVTGNLVGNVTGNIAGNVQGSVFGTLDGDMTGSVFGDDSTVLVDGVNNIISNGPVVIEDSSITTVNDQVLFLGTEFDGISLIQANTESLVVRRIGHDGGTLNLGTINIQTARGTYGVPQPLQTGDFVGNYLLTGRDGFNWRVKCIMLGQIDAPTVDNALPGKLLFALHDYQGNYTSGVNINSRHHLEAPVLKFTPYADVTARDTALPSGVVEAGMVIYLQSTNKLQVNNDGTTGGWIDLH